MPKELLVEQGAPTAADKRRINTGIELIHRAIPYPVILLAEHAGTVSLSFGHNRCSLRAQAQREKQLNRRVELNLHIKRLTTEFATIVQRLRQE